MENNNIIKFIKTGEAKNTLMLNGYADEEQRKNITTRILNLVSQNTSLANLEASSVFNVALKMVNMGLSPELETAYLVPYKTKASFQISYKGLQELAMRTGLYKKIDCVEVKESDILAFDNATGKFLFRQDKISFEEAQKRFKEPTIGYRAYAIAKDGTLFEEFMSNEEIDKHFTTYSKTWGKDKWGKDKKKSLDTIQGLSMKRKAVLKRLINRHLIKSLSVSANLSEDVRNIVDATKFDEAVITKENKAIYIDNPEQDLKEVPKFKALEKE